MRWFWMMVVSGVYPAGTFAQKDANGSKGWAFHRKGEVVAMWGWNRAAYTNSTLHIKGADYDITLHDIKAHDKPVPLSYYDYLKIDRITIPQTNLRIGYFVKDDVAVTFGVDHMKYVMTQDQKVIMDGEITRKGPYKGTYHGPFIMTEDFFTFEHTDGLNIINLGLEKHQGLLRIEKGKMNVGGLIGAELGVMMPKTNAKLMDYKRNDRFHVSGAACSIKAGVEIELFRHLTLRSEGKVGYISMPDIILHEKGVPGKGSQSFFFAQANVMIGGTFTL